MGAEDGEGVAAAAGTEALPLVAIILVPPAHPPMTSGASPARITVMRPPDTSNETRKSTSAPGPGVNT